MSFIHSAQLNSVSIHKNSFAHFFQMEWRVMKIIIFIIILKLLLFNYQFKNII